MQALCRRRGGEETCLAGCVRTASDNFVRGVQKPCNGWEEANFDMRMHVEILMQDGLLAAGDVASTSNLGKSSPGGPLYYVGVTLGYQKKKVNLSVCLPNLVFSFQYVTDIGHILPDPHAGERPEGERLSYRTKEVLYHEMEFRLGYPNRLCFQIFCGKVLYPSNIPSSMTGS